MGGLHKGHSELIKASQKFEISNPICVLTSVFVNPLQFGPGEDFTKYPRNLEKDCYIAEQAGSKALWAPQTEDIFPAGDLSNAQIEAPKNLISNLCGPHRPGHFDGVVNVVKSLLNLVKPEFLVLGEKDWQQLIIIRKLIKDLGLPIQIRGVATFRDSEGMAYSSRNTYLSSEEKQKALAIPKLLNNAARDFKSCRPIKLKEISNNFTKEGLEVDYIELVDPLTLQKTKQSKKICLLATAVKCGSTRLIDHKFLMTRKPIVAIDGPAGAGKSTVTKCFAKKIGLLYLDTGAMYRAVTWFIQKNNIDVYNELEIKSAVKEIKLELNLDDSGTQLILVNGNDVSEAIRSQDVTNLVSEVASLEEVRKELTRQQKKLGLNGGLVAEGRDIGTTVFPDAELKIFLTATIKERAQRRLRDLKERGFLLESIKEIEKQIIKRDHLDQSRDISPLIKAEDAIELITDGLNINEVVNIITELFRSKIPQEIWPSN